MKLIIIGGGDNAGAIIDLIDSNDENIEIIGISDKKIKGSIINGYEINITDEDAINLLEKSNIIISYAREMSIRKKIYDFFESNKSKFATLISSRAYVSKTAKIDYGAIVMPGAVIRNQVNIGKNTIINSNATIEHGCNIGKHCHLAPGVVLAGNVKVEDECFIGANSTILPNIIISKGCIVGAGSVVTKNIPQNEIWLGNPARRKGDKKDV